MIASEYKQEKRLKRSSAISNFGVQESLDRTEKVGDGNRLEVRTHLDLNVRVFESLQMIRSVPLQENAFLRYILAYISKL